MQKREIERGEQAEPMKSGLFFKVGAASVKPMCVCRDCPSYPGGGDRVVYCVRGASGLPVEKKGCICPKCRVYKLARLAPHRYFCFNGAARVLKKEARGQD